MVLLIWSTATFSGLNVCLLKCFGEILAVNDFWTMPFMVSSLIVSIILGAILQIIILNMALRYYNNLDVIPVYQSLILTMLLVCGWVLLNEISFYTTKQIFGLIGSAIIVISGIKVITMKTSVIASLKK